MWHNTDIAYIGISDGDDTVILKEDSEAYLVSARLMHTESPQSDVSKIAFSIKDSTIADLAMETDTGACHILRPKGLEFSPKVAQVRAGKVRRKKAGKTIITVSHPDAESREINLIVKKSDAVLAGSPYISTTQNIVTMIQGETISVAASLQNTSSYANTSWGWTSDDNNVASVLSSSMGTAMLRAVSPGMTRLHVTNTASDMPLEIIAIVLDARAAATRPVIQTNASILNMNVGEETTITAALTGNNSSRFVWTCSDGEKAIINGSDGACYIKALKAGSLTITAKAIGVSDVYDRSVFDRIEDTAQASVWIKPSLTVLQMQPTATDGITA